MGRGAPGSTRLHLVFLLVLAVVAGLLTTGGATAYTTAKRCGKVQAKGKTYSVRAHIVRCDFAKPASRRYLRQGRKPRGWSCTRYPARLTKIAFTCRRGGKDFYAIRR